MKLDKFINKDDRGVSSVIGVILMVAITVVLAAVIAGYLFNVSGMLNDPVTAGTQVQQTEVDDHPRCTDDDSKCYEVTMTVSSLSNTQSFKILHQHDNGQTEVPPKKAEVGMQMGPIKGVEEGDNIVIVAISNSGNEQVLRNERID